LESQATLKGSVGGTSIIANTAISWTITDVESAIVIISEIFGFSFELARQMLAHQKNNN
jgi:hypothetical protein